MSPTGTTSVTQWCEQWLTTYGTDLRPTTFASYRLQIDRYMTPQIGKDRLARLTPDHIEALKNYLATTPLSGTSRRYVLNVLSSALNRAVKSRKLHENPLRMIDLPPKSTTPLSVWDIEQTHNFLASIEGDRLEPLYVLAALCGLRQGERLGLRWSDTNQVQVTFQGPTPSNPDPNGGQTPKRKPPGRTRGRISSVKVGRGGAIRTLGLLNPIQVRYQAAPRPDGRKNTRRRYHHYQTAWQTRRV